MYHGSLTSAIRLTNDYHTPQNLSRVGRKPVKFGFKKSVFTPQTNGGGGRGGGCAGLVNSGTVQPLQ